MDRKRVVFISVVAGVLAGAGIAGGVAEASSGGGSPSSGSASSVATTAVVRTNLASTVQVGGSIGYEGSYTIAAPSGATAQQVAQDQQAVTQAQQALAADETTEADSTSADDQAEAAAQSTATSAANTLSADQAQEATDCAGRGASTPACNQDTQKVSQDQTQDNQAQQALAAAKDTATRDHDQNQAKVQADTTQLQAAQANLAALDVTAVNPGTAYTELPKVGQIITEDRAVYGVSDEPVPLLYGAVAAYRAFQVGMSAGADVGELTHDLIALGYGAGLTQSNSYTAATAAAVERWQTALGLPETGTVLLGQVVFEPGPIRVTTVTPSVGQAVDGGGSGSGSGGGSTVLTATSTTPIVTVALQVTQEYLVKPGDAVSVVLPDGTTTVGGRVETVGDVATCPNGSGSGSGSGPADVSPCSSSGSGNSSTPTVTVTVTLESTPPGATLDQAPVNVNITTERADNVLAVPVNALLALQGGGDAVEVVTTGSTHQLVGVTTGLYSNTMVQISGTGITAGTRVEVPSS
ncbi:MAG TPA: peptidoglycan-binding domain-containing protein [Acidimicrobiales bacterium]